MRLLALLRGGCPARIGIVVVVGSGCALLLLLLSCASFEFFVVESYLCRYGAQDAIRYELKEFRQEFAVTPTEPIC